MSAVFVIFIYFFFNVLKSMWSADQISCKNSRESESIKFAYARLYASIECSIRTYTNVSRDHRKTRRFSTPANYVYQHSTKERTLNLLLTRLTKGLTAYSHTHTLSNENRKVRRASSTAEQWQQQTKQPKRKTSEQRIAKQNLQFMRTEQAHFAVFLNWNENTMCARNASSQLCVQLLHIQMEMKMK